MRHLYAFSLAALFVVLGARTAVSDDNGAPIRFRATLSGEQEVSDLPPGFVETDASGRNEARFNKALTRVRVALEVEDLEGDFAAAHFHCGRAGENGPVALGFVSPGPLEFEDGEIRGTLRNGDFTGADCVAVVGRPVNNIASLAFAMREGLIYVNVHTSEHQGGEIRGQMHEDPDD